MNLPKRTAQDLINHGLEHGYIKKVEDCGDVTQYETTGNVQVAVNTGLGTPETTTVITVLHHDDDDGSSVILISDHDDAELWIGELNDEFEAGFVSMVLMG